MEKKRREEGREGERETREREGENKHSRFVSYIVTHCPLSEPLSLRVHQTQVVDRTQLSGCVVA